MLSKELATGRAGQHLVIADLLLRGIEAFGTGEGTRYDVVAEYGGRLVRIQVKATLKKRILKTHAKPIYFYPIRLGKDGKGIYGSGDVDIFALVGLDIKQVFYLWFDEVGTSSICIRDRNVKYADTFVGHKLYYQDLTWEKLLERRYRAEDDS